MMTMTMRMRTMTIEQHAEVGALVVAVVVAHVVDAADVGYCRPLQPPLW